MSLLNFSRKEMARFLKRDDRLIFSKIQKHNKNLEAVDKYIGSALENLPPSQKHSSALINIDNHQSQCFRQLQKYFLTSYQFWKSLPKTLRSSAY
jgi:hypothetical protein